MNETVIIAILAIVAGALILRSMLRARTQVPLPSDPQPLPGRASEELEELELDHAMGRVSEADYLRWKGSLGVAEAADVEPPASDARTRAESLVRQWKEKPLRRCETCGERPEPDARFCSNCGAGLA